VSAPRPVPGPGVAVATTSITGSASLTVAVSVSLIVPPTATAPAVSPSLLDALPVSSTGVSMSQSTSQSPWLPTTALFTVPTAAASAYDVYTRLEFRRAVPGGSVHASGFALLQVNGATGVTVPRSRPVPSVSVSTRS